MLHSAALSLNMTSVSKMATITLAIRNVYTNFPPLLLFVFKLVAHTKQTGGETDTAGGIA